MQTTEKIQSAANQFIELTLDILPAFAAVGLIAMAVVELLKLIPVKVLFHRRLLTLQFGHSADTENLIQHLSAGAEVVFLMQRPQAISEQIASLASYLLSFPEENNRELLKLLAKRSVSQACFSEEQDNSNKEISVSQSQHIDMLIDDLINNFDPIDMQRIQKYDKCKDLLTEMIKTNLTMLKNRMEFWWALFLQASSIVISAILIGYFLLYNSDSSSIDPLTLALFIFIGGLVAPASHDLIQKIKDRHK